MDLFSINQNKLAPLAERMRPNSLEDFVGQTHIVGEGTLLRRAIKINSLGSCIFWGAPGTGKSTLANIIAKSTNSDFYKLNAVSSGVADAKRIIDKAKDSLGMFGRKSYLLLDECHRWSKAQSDCMLEAIEKGYIFLIGSTTENPYVSMTPAIISRCRVFEFKNICEADLEKVFDKAIVDKTIGLGTYDVEVSDEAKRHLIRMSGGDVRNLLNALELAVLSSNPNSSGKIIIDLKVAEECIQKKSLSVDENLYYDLLSAFCKSLRGSDADASVYYALRLIDAGCDPRLIVRRLIVHSSEDVGMADPNALVIAVSALTALEKIGLPEAKIPIVNAIIYVALAEKSNSVVMAIANAEQDVFNTRDDNVPVYLRDSHYKNSDQRNGENTYLYPHDFGGYVKQQYLPDSVKHHKYYIKGNNGFEKNLVEKKTGNRD